MKQFGLILLDLDGVLIDSRDVMEAAWSRVRTRHGVDVAFGEYFAEIGRPFGDIMERLGLADLMPEIAVTYEAAATDCAGLARPYAGVPETLAWMAETGIKTGVVTSKSRPRATAAVAALGAGFVTVRAPSPDARGKPAPDLILLSMVDAATDPAETVYVGDMEVDHEAARRAGVDFVHAGWGYGTVEPDVTSFRSFSDLVDLGRPTGTSTCRDSSGAPSGPWRLDAAIS